MRPDGIFQLRRSSGQRAFRSLFATLPLAICSISCSSAETEAPSLTRVRSVAERFVSVDQVGRPAYAGSLPLTFRESVDLPADARLRLWWALAESEEVAPGSVRLIIFAGDDHQQIHERTLDASAATSWTQEVVDLSELGHGLTPLEVHLEAVDSRANLSGAISTLFIDDYPAERERPDPRPDVLVLAIDTLRADHLSCYGAARPTPHIDRIALRGTLFEQAHSPGVWTLPSFASMLTGLMPSQHGVLRSRDRLRAELPNLAGLFSEAGYETHGLHDGGYLRPVFGFHAGFDTYSKIDGLSDSSSAVDKLLETHRPPRLVFVHTYDVHAPYASVPEQYHSLYADIDHPDPMNVRDTGVRAATQGQLGQIDEEYFQFMRDLYDGEIRFVDDAIGEIMRQLEVAGRLEHTLIVVVSDHGEEFGDRGGVGHGHQLHLEMTKVPLILAGPGVPVGRRVSQTVGLSALFATLLELVGYGPELGPESVAASLMALLRDQSLEQGDPALAITEGRWGSFAVRSEHWTYIEEGEQGRLYDRRSDPSERSDVSSEHPEVVDRLRRAFTQGIGKSGMDAREIQTLPDETERELRALGYGS